MRIAFIVRGGLHPSGRYEVMPVLLGLLEALGRRHEVHAFALRHLPEPSTYTLRGFTVHDLGRPGDRSPFARLWQWRALMRALRASGPFDVVHGWWVDPAGLLAAFAGRRLNIPSVVTCDSGEFVSLPDIKYGMERTLKGRAIAHLGCRFATRVHVASEYMETLARSHGWSPMRIPIGIDIQRFSVSAPPRPEGPPWRLIQVASLNRVKDQYTLIDALALLRRDLDVRVELVGEDTLDGDLHHYVGLSGMLEHVTFHGYVPPDEIPSLLQAAHVYVQSSRHEAAGISVLESAAAALPVMGTSVGYVSDWSPHGSVAVPPADPAALAGAIASLINDESRRLQMADAARAIARSYDVDWSADALQELYIEIASRAEARTRTDSDSNH